MVRGSGFRMRIQRYEIKETAEFDQQKSLGFFRRKLYFFIAIFLDDS